MNNSILTEEQVLFLKLLSQQFDLYKQFYLTRGTALAAFYLPYRLSEDLDFFSEQEIPVDGILTFLRTIKNELNGVGILLTFI